MTDLQVNAYSRERKRETVIPDAFVVEHHQAVTGFDVLFVEDHRIQPKQTTYFNQTKYHRFQPEYGRVQPKYDYFLIFGNLGVVPKSTCVTILFFPL